MRLINLGLLSFFLLLMSSCHEPDPREDQNNGFYTIQIHPISFVDISSNEFQALYSATNILPNELEIDLNSSVGNRVHVVIGTPQSQISSVDTCFYSYPFNEVSVPVIKYSSATVRGEGDTNFATVDEVVKFDEEFDPYKSPKIDLVLNPNNAIVYAYEPFTIEGEATTVREVSVSINGSTSSQTFYIAIPYVGNSSQALKYMFKEQSLEMTPEKGKVYRLGQSGTPTEIK